MGKKHLFFTSLLIFVIGCSTLSLPLNAISPQATPTPQVIYKSPTEMNLRPGDIPELKAENIENPSPEPLLPEATDQNQRKFTGENINVTVETNIILLPGKTNRTITEIYDTVIPKRRPTLQKISEETVAVGEQAVLFKTLDDCGTGFVLISERSNIIFILIGCGSGITSDFIISIGNKIDSHITNKVAECSQLGLTEYECANAGIHQYSESWTSNDPENCPIGDQSTLTLSIIFSENNVYVNLSDNGWENESDYFSKISPNIYSSDENIFEGDWYFEFNFNDSGFILDEQFENHNTSCHWIGTFQRMK